MCTGHWVDAHLSFCDWKLETGYLWKIAHCLPAVCQALCWPLVILLYLLPQPYKVDITSFCRWETDSGRGNDYQADEGICQNSINFLKLRSLHVSYTSIFKNKKNWKATTAYTAYVWMDWKELREGIQGGCGRPWYVNARSLVWCGASISREIMMRLLGEQSPIEAESFKHLDRAGLSYGHCEPLASSEC